MRRGRQCGGGGVLSLNLSLSLILILSLSLILSLILSLYAIPTPAWHPTSFPPRLGLGLGLVKPPGKG